MSTPSPRWSTVISRAGGGDDTPAVHSKSGGGGVQSDLIMHSRSGERVISVETFARGHQAAEQEYVAARGYENTVETADHGHLQGDLVKVQEYVAARSEGTNQNSQVAVSDKINPNSQMAAFEESPPNDGRHQNITDGIDDNDVTSVKHLAKEYARDVLIHHARQYPEPRTVDSGTHHPNRILKYSSYIDACLNTKSSMNFISYNCPEPLPTSEVEESPVSQMAAFERSHVLAMVIQCLAVNALIAIDNHHNHGVMNSPLSQTNGGWISIEKAVESIENAKSTANNSFIAEMQSVILAHEEHQSEIERQNNQRRAEAGLNANPSFTSYSSTHSRDSTIDTDAMAALVHDMHLDEEEAHSQIKVGDLGTGTTLMSTTATATVPTPTPSDVHSDSDDSTITDLGVSMSSVSVSSHSTTQPTADAGAHHAQHAAQSLPSGMRLATHNDNMPYITDGDGNPYLVDENNMFWVRRVDTSGVERNIQIAFEAEMYDRLRADYDAIAGVMYDEPEPVLVPANGEPQTLNPGSANSLSNASTVSLGTPRGSVHAQERQQERQRRDDRRESEIAMAAALAARARYAEGQAEAREEQAEARIRDADDRSQKAQAHATEQAEIRIRNAQMDQADALKQAETRTHDAEERAHKAQADALNDMARMKDQMGTQNEDHAREMAHLAEQMANMQSIIAALQVDKGHTDTESTQLDEDKAVAELLQTSTSAEQMKADSEAAAKLQAEEEAGVQAAEQLSSRFTVTDIPSDTGWIEVKSKSNAKPVSALSATAEQGGDGDDDGSSSSGGSDVDDNEPPSDPNDNGDDNSDADDESRHGDDSPGGEGGGGDGDGDDDGDDDGDGGDDHGTDSDKSADSDDDSMELHRDTSTFAKTCALLFNESSKYCLRPMNISITPENNKTRSSTKYYRSTPNTEMDSNPHNFDSRPRYTCFGPLTTITEYPLTLSLVSVVLHGGGGPALRARATRTILEFADQSRMHAGVTQYHLEQLKKSGTRCTETKILDDLKKSFKSNVVHIGLTLGVDDLNRDVDGVKLSFIQWMAPSNTNDVNSTFATYDNFQQHHVKPYSFDGGGIVHTAHGLPLYSASFTTNQTTMSGSDLHGQSSTPDPNQNGQVSEQHKSRVQRNMKIKLSIPSIAAKLFHYLQSDSGKPGELKSTTHTQDLKFFNDLNTDAEIIDSDVGIGTVIFITFDRFLAGGSKPTDASSSDQFSFPSETQTAADQARELMSDFGSDQPAPTSAMLDRDSHVVREAMKAFDKSTEDIKINGKPDITTIIAEKLYTWQIMEARGAEIMQQLTKLIEKSRESKKADFSPTEKLRSEKGISLNETAKRSLESHKGRQTPYYVLSPAIDVSLTRTLGLTYTTRLMWAHIKLYLCPDVKKVATNELNEFVSTAAYILKFPDFIYIHELTAVMKKCAKQSITKHPEQTALLQDARFLQYICECFIKDYLPTRCGTRKDFSHIQAKVIDPITNAIENIRVPSSNDDDMCKLNSLEILMARHWYDRIQAGKSVPSHATDYVNMITSENQSVLDTIDATDKRAQKMALDRHGYVEQAPKDSDDQKPQLPPSMDKAQKKKLYAAMVADTSNSLLNHDVMTSTYFKKGPNNQGNKGGRNERAADGRSSSSRVDHSTGVVTAPELSGVFSPNFTDAQRGKAYTKWSSKKPHELLNPPSSLNDRQLKKYFHLEHSQKIKRNSAGGPTVRTEAFISERDSSDRLVLNCDPDVWWYMFFCRKQARANVYHAPGKGRERAEAMVAYEVNSNPNIMDADDLDSYSPEDWSTMRMKKKEFFANMAAKAAKKDGKDDDDTSSTRTGRAKKGKKTKVPPAKTDDEIRKQATEAARQEAIRVTAFNAKLEADVAKLKADLDAKSSSNPQPKSGGATGGGTN